MIQLNSLGQESVTWQTKLLDRTIMTQLNLLVRRVLRDRPNYWIEL